MSRVIALVQARTGSLRFPRKMLATLGGVPLLEWVLRRLQRANRVDQIVLATTAQAQDDSLAELARGMGVAVFRGSECDVLGRFAEAANRYSADTVVRVCADNPFIDSGEVDRLVEFFSVHNCDYACNHQDRLGSRYADGFGAEILGNVLLQHMAHVAMADRHREHATSYIWDNVDSYHIEAVDAPPELAAPYLRFDVDRPTDLAYLETLINAGVTINSSAREIVHLACVVKAVSREPVSDSVEHRIDRYLRQLFPLARSITGEPNRETLRVLQEIVPLVIHEVPTGTVVYDWEIPEEWSVRGAWIADDTGRRIVDFQFNNLHLVSYSVPTSMRLTWNELKSHVHKHPELPDAIPYRTTYYRRDWGFCVTHAQYDELENTTGELEVVVDTELKAGSLSYGEYLIPGRSTQEILISCYICHPSMANDSLSGVLLTAFLAQRIADIPDRHWSYRVVFVPETIGAVAYCALHEAEIKAIDVGLVVTTVGGPGHFGYKQSWQADHPVNSIIESLLKESGATYEVYPFDIHGSDERQYSSQGFAVNVATITRDRYYEYEYYHSSKDDLGFVTARQIAETLDLYTALLTRLESRKIYRNIKPNCEVMLSRHDLYPVTGGAQKPELGGKSELDLILWMLFLCDGKRDLMQISDMLGVPVAEVERLAVQLSTKKILELV